MSKHFLIVSDRIGAGDDELGRALMKNFLYSLARNDEAPSAVTLANEGVRLACTGSASLDDLALLQENGARVAACGTCLDFLGLRESQVVGQVGTMPEIVSALVVDSVVTIA